MSEAAPAGEASTSSASNLLYRAIWRWHFYAGLLSLPFMILLAVTGGLYLFKDELNRAFYASYLVVPAGQGTPLTAEAIVAKASAAIPGPAVGYVPPAAPDLAAQVRIKTEAGKQVVLVDPYTGAVKGDFADSGSAGTPLMHFIRKLHSLEYFGWLPNRMIEVVGGWALILVVTGIYLWWPRSQSGGIVSVRGNSSRRVFWRDLHAVSGAFAGVLIFFLAISGLPWSGYWGNMVNVNADQAGLGYPPEFWNEVPKSTVPMKEAMTHTPWSFENKLMPVSLQQPGATPISLDKAIAGFEALGFVKGYAIDLPSGPDGVYSASVFPDAVADERVAHLDQYTGKVLFNGGFDELGIVGKAIEWGISVHMGQEYGLLNQLLMVATCIVIVLMSVSALVMWWKRRPQGALGAPRYPADYRIPRTILLIALMVGIAFPLVGLSILVMLLIDVFLPLGLQEKLA